MKYFIYPLFLLLTIQGHAFSPFSPTEDLPSAYQGRFRSLDSTARLWLYDFYHRQQLASTKDASALDFLWRIHFSGHQPWDDTPLFWIHYAATKEILGLDTKQDRFTYKSLAPLLEKIQINQRSDELDQLEQSIDQFKSHLGGLQLQSDPYTALYTKLSGERRTPADISEALEGSYPLRKRLMSTGSTLLMLPLKNGNGDWVSLHAFHLPVYDKDQQKLIPAKNFTAFSDTHFNALRDAYFALQDAVINEENDDIIGRHAEAFAHSYKEAYAPLAGQTYRSAQSKTLSYPSTWRLKAETLYYHLPLIEATIAAYALALLLILAGHLHPTLKGISRFLFLSLILGFLLHTTVLALRSYILQRPPVSNMFETVVYVPWVAIVTGFLFYSFGKSRALMASATFASLALLILLRLTQVDSRLENVQAVLDSQYWLIIHVLMVVGSYGAFVVCGILGHAYLAMFLMGKDETEGAKSVAAGILHTMYLGVGLLIPGTILGGIWAAESWGRFWDWDPKESWAFISACVYVLFIHAYTFRRIADFGLAVGAVAGLMAISFTWYGVNYVLGTGLHSYGFGKGGEGYYFAYLAVEAAFLAVALAKKRGFNFIRP